MPVIQEAIIDLNNAVSSQIGLIEAVNRIILLAEESKINQESLGSVGACELIIKALKENENNPKKCESLLWAIAKLCRRDRDRYLTSSASNVVRLGDAGACELTVTVLDKHIQNPELCLAAFRAIANLAVITQSNKTKLRFSGACEAVVNALHTHINNERVVEQGCWVITYLACDHPDNKIRFGLAKGCQSTINCLIKYQDSEVVCARACGAIAFLAKDNNENRETLIELNACELVVKALHKHKNNKGVLQVTCHALLHLFYAMHPDRIKDLRAQGALDNRGWVIEKSYDDIIYIWNPDRVVREIRWLKRGIGFCGIFICSL